MLRVAFAPFEDEGPARAPTRRVPSSTASDKDPKPQTDEADGPGVTVESMPMGLAADVVPMEGRMLWSDAHHRVPNGRFTSTGQGQSLNTTLLSYDPHASSHTTATLGGSSATGTPARPRKLHGATTSMLEAAVAGYAEGSEQSSEADGYSTPPNTKPTRPTTTSGISRVSRHRRSLTTPQRRTRGRSTGRSGELSEKGERLFAMLEGKPVPSPPRQRPATTGKVNRRRKPLRQDNKFAEAANIAIALHRFRRRVMGPRRKLPPRYVPDLTPGPGSFDVSKTAEIKFGASPSTVIHRPTPPPPKSVPFDSLASSIHTDAKWRAKVKSPRLYLRDRETEINKSARKQVAGEGISSLEKAKHVHDIATEVRGTFAGQFRTVKRGEMEPPQESLGPGSYFPDIAVVESQPHVATFSQQPRFSRARATQGGFVTPAFLSAGEQEVHYRPHSARNFLRENLNVSNKAIDTDRFEAHNRRVEANKSRAEARKRAQVARKHRMVHERLNRRAVRKHKQRQQAWLVWVAQACRVQQIRDKIYKRQVQNKAKIMSMATNYSLGQTFYKWREAAKAKKQARCVSMLRMWFRSVYRTRQRVRKNKAADLLVRFLTEANQSDLITKAFRRLIGTVTHIKLWWLQRLEMQAARIMLSLLMWDDIVFRQRREYALTKLRGAMLGKAISKPIIDLDVTNPAKMEMGKKKSFNRKVSSRAMNRLTSASKTAMLKASKTLNAGARDDDFLDLEEEVIPKLLQHTDFSIAPIAFNSGITAAHKSWRVKEYSKDTLLAASAQVRLQERAVKEAAERRASSTSPAQGRRGAEEGRGDGDDGGRGNYSFSVLAASRTASKRVSEAKESQGVSWFQAKPRKSSRVRGAARVGAGGLPALPEVTEVADEYEDSDDDDDGEEGGSAAAEAEGFVQPSVKTSPRSSVATEDMMSVTSRSPTAVRMIKALTPAVHEPAISQKIVVPELPITVHSAWRAALREASRKYPFTPLPVKLAEVKSTLLAARRQYLADVYAWQDAMDVWRARFSASGQLAEARKVVAQGLLTGGSKFQTRTAQPKHPHLPSMITREAMTKIVNETCAIIAKAREKHAKHAQTVQHYRPTPNMQRLIRRTSKAVQMSESSMLDLLKKKHKASSKLMRLRTTRLLATSSRNLNR